MTICRNHFMSADCDYAKSKAAIIGFPMDLTVTGRHGTGLAPAGIREASYLLETYSPYQGKDLCDLKLSDVGDIELPFSINEAINVIERISNRIVQDNKMIISLGGEHLITLPIMKEIKRRYKDVAVIHIDAHLDMSENYLGIKLNHDTVMRRIAELIGMDNIYQAGQRSGSYEEWNLPKRAGFLYPFDLSGIDKIVNSIGKRHVYITVDIDVLDPSVITATGTPEPNGISYAEFTDAIFKCSELNVVGFDLVELSPPIDISGNSNVTAAAIIKEMLLYFGS